MATSQMITWAYCTVYKYISIFTKKNGFNSVIYIFC